MAQSLVNAHIIGAAGIRPDDLPNDCMLNPERDMYLRQESHKEFVRQGHVKCGFCGKTFKNQYYMDRHLDNKHPGEFLANASVCLADYCDILNCEPFVVTACQESDMERRRHRCRSIFDRCFPSDSDERLHNAFMHSFCGKVTPTSVPLTVIRTLFADASVTVFDLCVRLVVFVL